MIKTWYITGDCHRDFSRFKSFSLEHKKDSTLGVIILGDAGINYCLDEHDSQVKDMLMKKYGFYIYCVRGNHEVRPQNVEGMKLFWDENVSGEVWYEERWPRIRYFKDFGAYQIDGHSTLIIGGAYSVDKFYRLQNGLKWFEDEQLSIQECIDCWRLAEGKKWDLVLSHTCPRSWVPTDLFLVQVDQSTVDNSMENWLEEVKNSIDFGVWAFGHYHAHRLERPYVQQFFMGIEDLKDVWARWADYDKNGQVSEWWIQKSPNFYWGV